MANILLNKLNVYFQKSLKVTFAYLSAHVVQPRLAAAMHKLLQRASLNCLRKTAALSSEGIYAETLKRVLESYILGEIFFHLILNEPIHPSDNSRFQIKLVPDNLQMGMVSSAHKWFFSTLSLFTKNNGLRTNFQGDTFLCATARFVTFGFLSLLFAFETLAPTQVGPT